MRVRPIDVTTVLTDATLLSAWQATLIGQKMRVDERQKLVNVKSQRDWIQSWLDGALLSH